MTSPLPPSEDPPRPWGDAPDRQQTADAASPAAEPAFNISLRQAWGLAVILAGIGLGFVWQAVSPPDVEHLGALSINAIATNRWSTLLTHMFMHGGVLHLVMNLSALLPFGFIVAARMGPGAAGQLRFIAFYLACGLVAGVAWLVTGAGQGGAMVGASGAIFGLWGAVLRVRMDGGVHPLFSRAVARQLPGPIIANVIVAVAFEAANAFGGGIGGLAWQAHVGGFLFGLLTAGVVLPRRQP